MKSTIFYNNETSGPQSFWTTRNSTYVIPGVYDLSVEDTNWVLTSSFIIFTMQTGFGMLESGCVSIKNDVNIMMKNLIDIVLGVRPPGSNLLQNLRLISGFLPAGLDVLDLWLRPLLRSR